MEKQQKIKAAKSDMLSGGIFCIFAAAFFAETFTFKLIRLPNTVTSAFMPRLLAVLVFGCAAYLFMRGYRNWQKFSPEEKAEIRYVQRENRAGQRRCVLVVADLVFAACTFKTLGFLLTMPWMMFFMFIILEKKEKRNYKLYLILSLLSPIVVFAVFYYGFSQLLPIGILKPYLSQIL